MGSDEKLFVRDGEAWREHAPAPGLAEQLSREHVTYAVAWSISTVVDQVWIQAYREGLLVREVQYARDGGWIQRGAALPFEDRAAMRKWLRRRRLFASPDGYEVLDAFLGRRPPEPIAEPDASYELYLAPAHAAELRAIADRAGVPISAVVEAAWHLGKRAVYDRFLARANQLGLDLTMLVDDTSPPPPRDPPPFVHDPEPVPGLDPWRSAGSTLHRLALSPRVLAELAHLSTMFDLQTHVLLDEAYLVARPRLVVAPA